MLIYEKNAKRILFRDRVMETGSVSIETWKIMMKKVSGRHYPGLSGGSGWTFPLDKWDTFDALWKEYESSLVKKEDDETILPPVPPSSPSSSSSPEKECLDNMTQTDFLPEKECLDNMTQTDFPPIKTTTTNKARFKISRGYKFDVDPRIITLGKEFLQSSS